MGTRKLKLLLAIIDLDGGAGVFCRILATGLKRYFEGEFEISLLVCRPRAILPSDRQLFDRIEVTETHLGGTWRRAPQILAHAWQFRSAVRRLESDLVITVGNYVSLLLPLVVRNRPSIITVHNNLSVQLHNSRLGWLLARLIAWRYARNLVVGPTRGVVEDLARQFGIPRAHLIYHGIDLAAVRQQAQIPLPNPPPPRAYIVACGRLSAQKDYPTLLQAYAQARQMGLAEDLVIVGGGEDRALLAARTAALGLEATVHFLGHQDNPFPYLKPARFFVLSSLWEGFGLALVEAMSLGLPCIATDCPSGPAEILDGGRCGLLVPVHNPAALAQAMVRLAQSPQLQQQYRDLSLQRAEDFSLQRMARQYHDLILQTLAPTQADKKGVPCPYAPH